MAWYDEAVFYHIYPLGLTGAPKSNVYEKPVHRMRSIFPWIDHVKEIGCNAIYIGPLFESVGHGYETTDYKKLDSRLGTNEDLTDFVSECHKKGIRVILDGVFNHTGRDFFAFQDVKKNREGSRYKDWYCNVNFYGNNSYNDGFSYENWGGYDLLVKLNQHNPEVRDYICDVVRFWVSEFDIDGIRLDAADVMDFEYMKALRQAANEVKDDFWLMGEVIHGNYSRWANEGTLHSVTNYMLHKALYSGHNDRNYFEIAHTISYVGDMTGNNLHLYSFVDNHDVERIYTKLKYKEHIYPVHILLYTLPGIPAVYYGSEFGIEGRKEAGSDDSLRPAIDLNEHRDDIVRNPLTKLLAALGKLRCMIPALCYGGYRQLLLTNTNFAFARELEGASVIITVNNDGKDLNTELPAGNSSEYIGVLSGERIPVREGRIAVKVRGNYGEIWVPRELYEDDLRTVEGESIERTEEVRKQEEIKKAETWMTEQKEIKRTEAQNMEEEKAEEKEKENHKKEKVIVDLNKPYEEMTIEELQEAILEKMRKNGPVTEYMLGTVRENTHHGSLVTWVKSFQ